MYGLTCVVQEGAMARAGLESDSNLLWHARAVAARLLEQL